MPPRCLTSHAPGSALTAPRARWTHLAYRCAALRRPGCCTRSAAARRPAKPRCFTVSVTVSPGSRSKALSDKLGIQITEGHPHVARQRAGGQRSSGSRRRPRASGCGCPLGGSARFFGSSKNTRLRDSVWPPSSQSNTANVRFRIGAVQQLGIGIAADAVLDSGARVTSPSACESSLPSNAYPHAPVRRHRRWCCRTPATPWCCRQLRSAASICGA